MLYLKSKSRQFGAAIKIASDLLENESSQFEGAEYKYENIIFYVKPKFR